MDQTAWEIDKGCSPLQDAAANESGIPYEIKEINRARHPVAGCSKIIRNMVLIF